ncbi:GNAT family N-acetyltransferase [Pseudobacteriovorax antillogorgiicola]|uniref:Acetyltransferase (GNAT) domain-containing protein n=1 Tax=Pseudobacteriovorax antillogorgiicola TaxID=1513793 RepID=A0A1Y6CBB0_9BACT|nr:GNAT family N-acetyltransferase [Pseudobacteriovorax antillogorgiicola]TCS48632.1 acetyltransferase (GNAT) family protein [Pseudobacteriovorax antillogorgiicola]SMF55344.1 Acetyltransferase (GNAT) domain-containing protein [Pseudobacteriovorax antillogorgiicola]
MAIACPQTESHIALRNQLLQNALRPEPLPFKIQSEYPIVLGEKGTEFSHCLFHDDRIVAHANLWPRDLMDSLGQRVAKVGLIGNVATDESYRGQGFMKQLFQSLESKAILADLEALILWSDLSLFYQKLGFQSLSQEWHHQFDLRHRRGAGNFRLIPSDEIHLVDPTTLLAIRTSTRYTLHRSPNEFLEMLHIPNLDLCLEYGIHNEVIAYCITGKGYDMIGVIHEWGAPSIDHLVNMIRFVQESFKFPEIILLSPGTLAKSRRKQLDARATKTVKGPMGLVKLLKPSKSIELALDQCFIWGLDSI